MLTGISAVPLMDGEQITVAVYGRAKTKTGKKKKRSSFHSRLR